MANPFVHVELNTNDPTTAENFYGNLFDWNTVDLSTAQGRYTTIDVGQGTGGGMIEQHKPTAPSGWLPYVAVDDIHATTRKAKELGATITKEVTEVADMGWLSVIVDPTGATLGLWQAKSTAH